MSDVMLKNKWKIFAIDQLTCAEDCSALDRVALFDRLVGDNHTGMIGVEGVEIWEPFMYWEFQDFCDYLLALATAAQETELCRGRIKDKWKKYVVEQFVASYSPPLSKVDLFDMLTEGDAKFVIEMYKVKFFSIYRGKGVELVRTMAYNAMMIQQIDNEE